MNCTEGSIWFKYSPKLLIYFLFTFISFESYYCQGNSSDGTWQLKLDVDNYFSIRSAWSSEGKTASVVVYDSNDAKHFALSLITISDEWNHFNFPEDFVALSAAAKNAELLPQNLIFEVRVKRSVEARKTFFYDPSPNALLQLDFYPFHEKLDTTIVWGSLIDAYQWIDKKGDNIVVRSELITKSLAEDSTVIYKKYLYLYHFRKEQDSLQLVRKFTDVYGECNGIPNAGFSLPSIELTDIDRDTIGEISSIYDLYCKGGDTTNYHSKLLLTTDGKKFMLDAIINPCGEGEEKIEEYAKFPSFKFYPYLLRFMEGKLENYHFE